MWMFDIWYETVEQVMKCMMRDNQYRTGDHRSEESKGHPPLLPLIVFRRRWTLQGHASHDLSADTTISSPDSYSQQRETTGLQS